MIRFLLTSLWLTLGSTHSVLACPYCNSEIGQDVAAGIFNENFGQNMLLTLIPIPIFLLIIAIIHFGWPWTWFSSRNIDSAHVNLSEKHYES